MVRYMLCTESAPSTVTDSMRHSWASSHVRWLNGKCINAPRTISVHVIMMRTAMVLELLIYLPLNHRKHLLAQRESFI